VTYHNIRPSKTMVGSQKKKKHLPIGTTFKLPADIPIWPQGSSIIHSIMYFFISFLHNEIRNKVAKITDSFGYGNFL